MAQWSTQPEPDRECSHSLTNSIDLMLSQTCGCLILRTCLSVLITWLYLLIYSTPYIFYPIPFQPVPQNATVIRNARVREIGRWIAELATKHEQQHDGMPNHQQAAKAGKHGLGQTTRPMKQAKHQSAQSCLPSFSYLFTPLRLCKHLPCQSMPKAKLGPPPQNKTSGCECAST